jgi:hypothetical protein
MSCSKQFSPRTLYSATACSDTPANEDIRCALITSTVKVSAPQAVEPSEAELRDMVTATLREAINGEGFEEFLPPGCLIG